MFNRLNDFSFKMFCLLNIFVYICTQNIIELGNGGTD